MKSSIYLIERETLSELRATGRKGDGERKCREQADWQTARKLAVDVGIFELELSCCTARAWANRKFCMLKQFRRHVGAKSASRPIKFIWARAESRSRRNVAGKWIVSATTMKSK